MCQGYEGEKKYIIAGENRASLRGFASAMESAPKSANPYTYDGYNKEAWDHGWGCWQEGILPYALDAEFSKKKYDNLNAWWAMEKRFKITRELSEEMLVFLKKYL
ncbi:MAG: hypothetical protein AAB378_02065 [Patescibacteria group bacterium]